jgi:hypothetical protein
MCLILRLTKTFNNLNFVLTCNCAMLCKTENKCNKRCRYDKIQDSNLTCQKIIHMEYWKQKLMYLKDMLKWGRAERIKSICTC